MSYKQLDSEYGLDPIGRPVYPGIYSAKVIDVTDPLKRNRIKVQVQQITGEAAHNWAEACLPVSANSYHPDHQPHTAAQIAALLTTTSTTASDPQGGSVTIPALTVVAKSGGGQLNHAHTATKTMVNKGLVVNAPTSTTDTKETSLYTTASGLSAPGTTSSNTSVKIPEHTFHRNVPVVGQLVWVMFIAGNPEHPVWMGVQS
jgi:hypothetical protein